MENGISGVFSTLGGVGGGTRSKFWLENLKKGEHSKFVDEDGRIILKQIHVKYS